MAAAVPVVALTSTGPTNGALVALWLASRFGSPPAYNSAQPGGAPNYGPLTSGVAYGSPGEVVFPGVLDNDYYIQVSSGGNVYWYGPITVVDNSEVLHLAGAETITGAKTVTAPFVIGKGTPVTTQTGGGVTQNTLDDGSGNVVVAGTLSASSNAVATPDIVLGSADTGPSTYTTQYGINRDSNSAVAINAKSVTGGVYTQADGVKKNTVDDGAGNAAVAGALVVGTGLTVTAGAVNLPAGSIPSAAVAGLTAGYAGVDVGSSQSLTGVKTFANDVVLAGSNLIASPLATATAPTVTATGTTGLTIYQYEVVAVTFDGADGIPSPAGSTTTGNATLSGANYNALSWAAVPNAGTYKVLRWNGSVYQLLVAGLSAANYHDTGAASPSTYVAATANPGGAIIAPGGGLVPTGVVLPFAAAAAPSGWLLCDGTAVNRITFAALFATVGTAYGAGNGTTTFNVPDMRGRMPLGTGASTAPGATTHTLGQAGGEETHALSDAELAAHNHTGVTGGRTAAHVHAGTPGAFLTGGGTSAGLVTTGSNYVQSSSTAAETTDHLHGIPIDGSGVAHNTLAPYLGLAFIIKT